MFLEYGLWRVLDHRSKSSISPYGAVVNTQASYDSEIGAEDNRKDRTKAWAQERNARVLEVSQSSQDGYKIG